VSAVTRAALHAACAGVLAFAQAHASAAPEWLEANLGGDTTLAIANENAFARPLANLPVQDLRKFTFGNRIFNTNWVTAPASVDAFDGLGPVFNRVSCSACHTRDGRGRPPESQGEPLQSMLVRLSVPGTQPHGGIVPVPHYGDQLNERAIQGVPAEGRTVVRYTELSDQYPDGTPFTLIEPTYEFVDLAFGPLPADVRFSPRVATPVFGLGLLEAVPTAAIIARADPNDSNHDGISGRPNWVWDRELNAQVLGRFGWKANQPSLRQQNAGAALGDIGITSSLFPKENIAEGQQAAAAAPTGAVNGEPELKDDFFDSLTFYTQTLAVPAARGLESEDVQRGATLFEQLRCSGCHVATLTTGTSGPKELRAQRIHPFTDLLLHDMGAALADGRAEFEASGSEWRTAPLWGIGLTATVNRHTRFLHDGRARSLEEAVLWHGGEARTSRSAFMNLSKEDRAALLKFLDAL
jgi:CxxC motif-containing protein (DUF1111 family)